MSERRDDVPSIELTLSLACYNEDETLESVVAEARAAGAALTPAYEVLIVDDGSTDRSREIADRLAAEHPDVRVHKHPTNQGFSGVQASCIREAAGTWAFMASADGQTRFADVPRFWASREIDDLIFGVRAGRRDSPVRKVFSLGWYTFIRVLYGTGLPEFSAGFLFHRERTVALFPSVRPDTVNFLPMLFLRAQRAGARVALLPTQSDERRGGDAKGGTLALARRTMIENIVLARAFKRENAAKSDG